MIGRTLTLCLCMACGFLEARQSPPAPPSAPAPSLLRIVSEAQATITARRVKDWTLPAGRAVFRLEDGVLVEIRSGSRVVGHYFQGRGHLDYRSEDRVEAKVFDSTSPRTLP